MIIGIDGEDFSGDAGMHRGGEKSVCLPDFLAQEDLVSFLNQRLGRLAEVLEKRDHDFFWSRHALKRFVFCQLLDLWRVNAVRKGFCLHSP